LNPLYHRPAWVKDIPMYVLTVLNSAAEKWLVVCFTAVLVIRFAKNF
jgi:hypothetical protein